VAVPGKWLDVTARELKSLLRNVIDASPVDQFRAEREAQARLLTAMLPGSGK